MSFVALSKASLNGTYGASKKLAENNAVYDSSIEKKIMARGTLGLQSVHTLSSYC
jgi:hypothetical protein